MAGSFPPLDVLVCRSYAPAEPILRAECGAMRGVSEYRTSGGGAESNNDCKHQAVSLMEARHRIGLAATPPRADVRLLPVSSPSARQRRRQ